MNTCRDCDKTLTSKGRVTKMEKYLKAKRTFEELNLGLKTEMQDMTKAEIYKTASLLSEAVDVMAEYWGVSNKVSR